MITEKMNGKYMLETKLSPDGKRYDVSVSTLSGELDVVVTLLSLLRYVTHTMNGVSDQLDGEEKGEANYLTKGIEDSALRLGVLFGIKTRGFFSLIEGVATKC